MEPQPKPRAGVASLAREELPSRAAVMLTRTFCSLLCLKRCLQLTVQVYDNFLKWLVTPCYTKTIEHLNVSYTVNDVRVSTADSRPIPFIRKKNTN